MLLCFLILIQVELFFGSLHQFSCWLLTVVTLRPWVTLISPLLGMSQAPHWLRFRIEEASKCKYALWNAFDMQVGNLSSQTCLVPTYRHRHCTAANSEKFWPTRKSASHSSLDATTSLLPRLQPHETTRHAMATGSWRAHNLLNRGCCGLVTLKNSIASCERASLASTAFFE